MLYEFLSSHREELISRCRRKVAQRQAPRATGRELDYGISVFLAQLTEILRNESFDCDAKSTSGRSFGHPDGSRNRNDGCQSWQ
jgi:hypothetical protein